MTDSFDLRRFVNAKASLRGDVKEGRQEAVITNNFPIAIRVTAATRLALKCAAAATGMSTYRCLAYAFAHLGRDAEAREAAARMLEVDPAFTTISAWIAGGGQSKSKLLIEGLRKAGLPE
jgi:hypothetical protein